MTEDRTWALLEDRGAYRYSKFLAAKIVKKTDKTVTFSDATISWMRGDTRREISWLLAEGLTKKEAVLAAERCESSVALSEEEARAARERHKMRVTKIVERLTNDHP